MKRLLFLAIVLSAFTGCEQLTFQGEKQIVLSKGQGGLIARILGGQAQYCKMVVSDQSENGADGYEITEEDVKYLLEKYCPEADDKLIQEIIQNRNRD